MRTCELCMDDHLNMKFVGLWKISEGPTYSLWLQNRDTYSDEYSDTCSSHTHTPGGWVPLIIKEYLTQRNADTQWCRTGIYQAAVAHTELVSTVRCWFCLPLGFVNSERNTEYHHACALKRSLLICETSVMLLWFCCSRVFEALFSLGSAGGQCLKWDCALECNEINIYVCVFVHAADDLPKKKPPALYKPTNPDGLAYLDFSVSTTGMLAGVQVSSALILTKPLPPGPTPLLFLLLQSLLFLFQREIQPSEQQQNE